MKILTALYLGVSDFSSFQLKKIVFKHLSAIKQVSLLQ